MPFLLVNSTSLPTDNDKEVTRKLQNKNGTTEISTIKTPFVITNNVLIIVLLTMATLFIIALCTFFYNCLVRRNASRRRKNLGDEPNAPGRQQRQEAFDFQRKAMLEPQKDPVNLDFTIFQSDSSSFRANLSRWAPVKNLPAVHSSEQSALRKEKQPSNYATTPRSVFPTLSRKWGENSIRRIEHLRTKLVARFPSSSSHSTSDISVFFSASSRNSEWGECSQLNVDEDTDTFTEVAAGKGRSKSGSSTNRIPSIVIEFVE